MKKFLAVGVILFFISVNVIPSTSTIVEKKSNILTFNEGSLSGYVNDTSMNPIEGARMRVCFHGTYEENFSDSSGYYHVTNIPICNCTKNCTAFKEGYKPECVWLSIYKNTTYDFVLTPGNTLYVGGSGEGNYTKIQDAIDNASDGDTVFVYNGTYNECLIVNNSINLIGEDKNTTILEGWENGEDGIGVYADSVTVTSFTFKKFKYWIAAGVHLYSSCNNSIVNNIFNNNAWGIRIDKSHNNILLKNTIYLSQADGIFLEHRSNNNIVAENQIYDNGHRGINLVGNFNNVSENKISNNIMGGIDWIGSYNSFIKNTINHHDRGLELVMSNHNWIYNNTISDNKDGLALLACKSNNISNNIFLNNSNFGIKLINYYGEKSDNNTLWRNTFSNNKQSIRLWKSSNNILSENNIEDNKQGISITWGTSNNIISENNIEDNTEGICIEVMSNSNEILNNNFINNKISARFYCLSSRNTWDGNYWNRARILPKPIIGSIGLIVPSWVNFDWHPAQEPYDIEV